MSELTQIQRDAVKYALMGVSVVGMLVGFVMYGHYQQERNLLTQAVSFQLVSYHEISRCGRTSCAYEYKPEGTITVNARTLQVRGLNSVERNPALIGTELPATCENSPKPRCYVGNVEKYFQIGTYHLFLGLSSLLIFLGLLVHFVRRLLAPWPSTTL